MMAWAAATIVFLLEGRHVTFIETQEVLISADCRRDGDRFDCAAGRALESATRKGLEGAGGKLDSQGNGISLCRAQGGARFVGQLPTGAENSFCKFKDGSYLSLGSLVRAATENDRH